MNAEIRAATAADIQTMLALVEQYWIFEDLPGFDAARVTEELGRVFREPALGNAWIATSRGRAIGYLLAVYVFSLGHLGLTVEIDEFFVLPTARGRKTGAGLLKAAEAEFGRRGSTNVALQLGAGNDRARVFYRSHGYRERAGFELLDKTLPDRRSG